MGRSASRDGLGCAAVVSRRAPLILVALVLASCGNERTAPPDVTTPGPPLGSSRQSDPSGAISFLVPTGWRLDRGQLPLVATISTGQASIAIWRYPRTEPLPATRAQLDQALNDLVAAAKARDPSFAELARDRLRVDGKPAVQLRGTESVAGQPRTVRSTHVYADGHEVVIDAMVPERDAARIDELVTLPLIRELRL